MNIVSIESRFDFRGGQGSSTQVKIKLRVRAFKINDPGPWGQAVTHLFLPAPCDGIFCLINWTTSSCF
jgi:hypothetical protein